jgi:8-oxo-dGTP pyrophosphatase MutT (NUDIX family)
LLSKYKDHRGHWYVMPGGGQQAGETLEECLVREVEEELGITVEVGALMYLREIIEERHRGTDLPAGFHQVEVFFDCVLPDGEEPNMGQVADAHQVGHAWVELDRLKDLLFFPLALADRITDPALRGRYLGDMR